MELYIEIDQPLMELLLQQAAEQELSAEEIIVQAIQNYMKGRENIA